MRERFFKFMQGRYGSDELNRTLGIVGCVLAVLWLLLQRTGLGSVLWLLWVAVLVFMSYRMFSRDIPRRAKENEKYKKLRYDLTGFVRIQRERWLQRKTYKFFKCPSCHATLRVPRGKGKINIVCRRCGNSFRGKT